jgi:hypothetical protein
MTLTSIIDAAGSQRQDQDMASENGSIIPDAKEPVLGQNPRTVRGLDSSVPWN